MSKNALHQLSKYRWNGNIRELRNLVEKAVLLSDGPLLKPADFEVNTGIRDMQAEVQEFNLVENERMIILKALKAFGYNKKLTARELGINRTTLYNKMRKHGFESL